MTAKYIDSQYNHTSQILSANINLHVYTAVCLSVCLSVYEQDNSKMLVMGKEMVTLYITFTFWHRSTSGSVFHLP